MGMALFTLASVVGKLMDLDQPTPETGDKGEIGILLWLDKVDPRSTRFWLKMKR